MTIRSTTHGLTAVFACSLLACGGGGSKGASAPSREAQSVLPTKITPGIEIVGDAPEGVAESARRIFSLASRARHLTPKSPVKLETLAPEALITVVKKHVDTEVPPEEIHAEGHVLVGLGLVPADYDFEAETYALLKEQLAGLYIPENATMYLSKSVPADEVESTLAHELVHALQDQYFGLGAKMKFRKSASDELSALSTLAEGDATVAMFDEMILAKGGERALEHQDTSQVDDVDAWKFLDATGDKAGMTKLANAPRFIALDLVAPYADGMTFVNSLRRRGGWRAVDAAWSRPPSSTEQLLHLDKYFANEPAIAVPPATSAALGAGWKRTWDDVVGEQEARLAFSIWMSPRAAVGAADGWGGDRATLFEADGGKIAVAWSMVFDDEANAKEAQEALVGGWTSTFGAPQRFDKPFDVVAFGLPAPAPANDAKGKDGKAARPKESKGALPALPDRHDEAAPAPSTSGLPALPAPAGDGTSAPAKATAVLKGCRATARNGRVVAIVTTPVCDATVAWATEVAKIAP